MSDAKRGITDWTELVTLPVAATTLGLVLVVGSLLPITHSVSRAFWSDQDAAAYGRISLELHQLAHQSPRRAGLSESEVRTRREHLRKECKAMKDKLENARQQPYLWRQYLLWSGVLLTGIGGFSHFVGSAKTNSSRS